MFMFKENNNNVVNERLKTVFIGIKITSIRIFGIHIDLYVKGVITNSNVNFCSSFCVH